MHLHDWIGKTETANDVIRVEPARFLQATLDAEPSLKNGDMLPPLWHWLYFLSALPQSELGRDAHPKKGGFLPPVPLPRRMWAGGDIQFSKPLIIGKPAQKTSTINSITEKAGRSGPLCFVTVRHEISQDGQIALAENQTLVFREDPKLDGPLPQPDIAPDVVEFSVAVQPTEVMLFRYSALTFNGHRIHYDADYARNVEGYDGLVFHGPLIATMLAELAQSRNDMTMKSFSYRGVTPITGMDPFILEGTRDETTSHVWARRMDKQVAMKATAEFG